MEKKIAIGADHAGYELKETLKKNLIAAGYEPLDMGAHSREAADYPDIAHPLAQAIEMKNCDLGILICGSGNGVAITANKHAAVRAALCWNEELAALARRHNNANVLCLPARFVSIELAEKITAAFLKNSFEGGRHEARVRKISAA